MNKESKDIVPVSQNASVADGDGTALELPKPSRVTVPMNLLVTALGFVPKDDKRGYLQGINLRFRNFQTEVCATDGARLFLAAAGKALHAPAPWLADHGVIISAELLQRRLAVIGDLDVNEVVIESAPSSPFVSIMDTQRRIVIRHHLIDAQFPDYSRILQAAAPVMEEQPKEAVPIGLSSKIFADLQKTVSTLCGSDVAKHAGNLEVYARTDKDPVLILFPARPGALVIAMPAKLQTETWAPETKRLMASGVDWHLAGLKAARTRIAREIEESTNPIERNERKVKLDEIEARIAAVTGRMGDPESDKLLESPALETGAALAAPEGNGDGFADPAFAEQLKEFDCFPLGNEDFENQVRLISFAQSEGEAVCGIEFDVVVHLFDGAAQAAGEAMGLTVSELDMGDEGEYFLLEVPSDRFGEAIAAILNTEEFADGGFGVVKAETGDVTWHIAQPAHPAEPAAETDATEESEAAGEVEGDEGAADDAGETGDEAAAMPEVGDEVVKAKSAVDLGVEWSKTFLTGDYSTATLTKLKNVDLSDLNKAGGRIFKLVGTRPESLDEAQAIVMGSCAALEEITEKRKQEAEAKKAAKASTAKKPAAKKAAATKAATTTTAKAGGRRSKKAA